MNIKNRLLRLRTPGSFLTLCIFASVTFIVNTFAGLIAAVVVFYAMFSRNTALVLSLIYVIFQLFWLSTAFVTDVTYGKNSALITTKGYLRGFDDSIKIGDVLVGRFEYVIGVSRTTGLPYRRVNTSGEYSVHRLPLVSNLLTLRQKHSASMLNRSGGAIVSTQAHIFAVRKYIPDKLNDEYIITGLAHLLAMSGFHVGIFVGGFFLLSIFLPRKVAAIPLFFLLPVLIPLSGFTVTVIRAVLFSMAAMAAWVLDLKVMSVSFIAVLAGFFLLFAPFNLVSISFLLSFFAVFGILVVFKSNTGIFTGIVKIGLASTVFTLPLQLFFFGTSNIASVVTTAIMTPVVWVQMMLGLLSIPFLEYMINPLTYLEQFAAWLMSLLSNISWYFMYVSKPHTTVLVISFIISFAFCFTKFRLLSLWILLLPLMPIHQKDVLIFPKLPASQKGYILQADGKSEIFFMGMRNTFVRTMLPEVAKLGIKTFDHGSVRLYDGQNLYIKINSPEKTGLVCLNDEEGCLYHYFTKSNSITSPLNDNTTLYVIYNNKYKDDKIFLQNETNESLIIKLKE